MWGFADGFYFFERAGQLERKRKALEKLVEESNIIRQANLYSSLLKETFEQNFYTMHGIKRPPADIEEELQEDVDNWLKGALEVDDD